MTLAVSGDSITFNDQSVQNTAATGFAFKNRIINGDMRIDQRNAGASVTPTADNTFTLDRWSAGLTQTSKYSVQRSTTTATGFTNSLQATSLSSYSLGAGDAFLLSQNIEGFNVADLGWGTAAAQTVTLSFWTRSSLTGTFGGVVANSAANRSYPFTYTISAANTWEQKTVTIIGDTTGTWLTDNSTGMRVRFSLGAGSTYSGTAGAWAGSLLFSATGATSVVGTSGATFYITGVQLEKGSTATSFDYRDYGRELIMCQRYFQKFSGLIVSGYQPSGYNNYASFTFPVELRATPTMLYTTIASANSGNATGSDQNTKMFRVSALAAALGHAYVVFNADTSGTEL